MINTIKKVKVKVVMEFKHEIMKEILPLDYELHLIPILLTKEKVLVNEQKRLDKKTGKWFVANPAVIAPIGTYDGYRFTGANGLVYDDKCLYNFIGSIPANKIFKKYHGSIRRIKKMHCTRIGS